MKTIKFIKKYTIGKIDIISTIAWILYYNQSCEVQKSHTDFTKDKIKLTKVNIISYAKEMVVADEFEQSFIQVDENYDESLFWEEAEEIFNKKYLTNN